MSIGLTRQFFKLLVHFRQHDLVSFRLEHFRLYGQAKESGDYGPCIGHYYSLMSKLIEEYFCGSFHFVPPLSAPSLSEHQQQQQQLSLLSTTNDGGAREETTTSASERTKTKNRFSSPSPLPSSATFLLYDSLRHLHQRFGECLSLGPDKNCLDIGCGIGDVIEHLAVTGAQLTGMTLSEEEVRIGNANFQTLGIHTNCRLMEADCSKVFPLASASQHSAYAIYSLKYLPKLGPVFAELRRVLRPDGLFLVYDLLRTDKFDENNSEHRELLKGLEVACGMPPLHSRKEMLAEAAAANFVLVKAVDLDLETGKPFHYCFSHSRFFMWLIRSPLVGLLIKLAQLLRILPAGFHQFNKVFLSGTVDRIVRAGELGILSGAEILLFKLEK